MRTKKIIFLISIVLMVGLLFSGCKKDTQTSDTLVGVDAALAQDVESQDAIAENIDQNTDNTIDALEANDFSGLKSAQVAGPSWTISPNKDTSALAFPKVITLTYNTDTTINGEKFKQSGKILVYLSLREQKYPWKNYIKREIVFDNYKVETDSSSFAITGSRTMKRISVKTVPEKLTSGTTSFSLDVVDSINSNMTLAITSGDYSGSFTRFVKKKREAIAHFEKGAMLWRQAFLKDTLIFKGSVTGKNLQDSLYSRTIDANKPIIFTRCASLNPVITSGIIAIVNGSKTASITYSADGCKTKAVMEKNGKTKEIERKINRKYKKWW